MRNRLTPLLCTAALTVLPIMSTADAHATDYAKRCPKSQVCAWTKAHFRGERHTRLMPGDETGCKTLHGRSLSNQWKRKVTIYSSWGCYGKAIDIKPHHYISKSPFYFKSVAIWGPL